jgi:hypothetical protein
MSDITLTNAKAYAARHHLRLAERLGFGIHGTVYVVEHERKESAHPATPCFTVSGVLVFRRDENGWRNGQAACGERSQTVQAAF